MLRQYASAQDYSTTPGKGSVMTKYQKMPFICAAIASLLMPAWDALAAELATVCWQATRVDKPERTTLLRMSVTETGTGHYTYTGMFEEADGAKFAILGALEVDGSQFVGSFSGSKTTVTDFKTAIYRVTLDASLVGSAEGIRHKYDRSSQSPDSVTEYRLHTLAPVSCR